VGFFMSECLPDEFRLKTAFLNILYAEMNQDRGGSCLA
jgi:hypothetical protein